MGKLIENMVKKSETKIRETCAIKLVLSNQPLELVAHCSGLPIEEIEIIAKKYKF
jgi:hypothetical protein